MNREQSTERSPHVEQFPTTPLFPTTPSHNTALFWPTPTSESGLSRTPVKKQGEQPRGGQVQEWEIKTTVHRRELQNQERGNELLETQLARHTHFSPPTNAPLPPVAEFQRLSSSTPWSPYEHQDPFRTPQAIAGPVLQTPPSSVGQSQQRSDIPTTGGMMADPRRIQANMQRSVMGPPETPSRGMIHASPGLFPNLQFSPDFFSAQSMDPASAPVYPQQRLFWDPGASTPISNASQIFHTPGPFPEEYNNSFHPTPSIIPPSFASPQGHQHYHLPTVSRSMSTPFMDNSAFPAPFQTSPRVPPPQQENPTLFLSSPARRFGGTEMNLEFQTRRTGPELPAYHHQIQESIREKQLARERRRSRASKLSADDDLIMKSVRRALSPTKQPRPGLQRSNTHTGVRTHALNSRRQPSVAFADTASIGSNGSSRSGRPGRSSPIRRVRDHERQLSGSSLARARTSVSLAIDANGVAHTIMTSLPENDDDDDEMEVDDESHSEISSRDENDDQILYSFAAEDHDILGEKSYGDARNQIKTNAYLSMGSDKVAKVTQQHPNIDPRLPSHAKQRSLGATRSRGGTLNTDVETVGSGNAQQALRAIMQDRSRSASSHENPSSNSSLQFHSSPPIQTGQFANYNASPTTITDPDLATPSTDADSLSSVGATRCVCNSSSPDGNVMIQW